jgi:hypothetical protein
MSTLLRVHSHWRVGRSGGGEGRQRQRDRMGAWGGRGAKRAQRGGERRHNTVSTYTHTPHPDIPPAFSKQTTFPYTLINP